MTTPTPAPPFSRPLFRLGLPAFGITLCAYLMGASWLGNLILGIPLGIWIAGGMCMAPRAMVFFGFSTPQRAMPGASVQFSTPVPSVAAAAAASASAGDAAGLDTVKVVAATVTERAVRGAENLRAAVVHEEPDVERAESRTTNLLLRVPRVTRPLNVGIGEGVVGRDDIADVLRKQGVEPRPRASLRDVTSGVVDAGITSGAEGSLMIRTPIDGEREASWFDWASPRPLTMITASPYRVDPDRCTLGGDLGTMPETCAHMAAAAAAFSRDADRLGLRSAILARFAEQPEQVAETAFVTLAPLAAAGFHPAASVLSAWCASPRNPAPIERRIDAIERTLIHFPSDPVLHLRAGILRLTRGDDEGGMKAMQRAAGLLRQVEHRLPDADHAGLLHAEIEHGDDHPLTFGRAAAGIVLATASSSVDQLHYFRDDLIDELDRADWLIGNDPDAVLLHRLFGEILRVRRADDRGLPAKTAA